MQHLFYFHAAILNKRSDTTVIKGSREWIELYIELSEFSNLFGGYVTWRAPDRSSDQMIGEALGVWGKRSASRLRRILRERGAEFDVINSEGPKQQLLVIETL